MRRHFVALAAFLVQPHPPALAAGVIVLDLHGDDGADAGEAVDHHADQRAVAQADERSSVRRRVTVPTLMLSSARAWSSVSTGVLPRRTTCLGPRTACAGLTARTWPTTSQSNSMRIAARCCFDGRLRRRVALQRLLYRRRRGTARYRRARRCACCSTQAKKCTRPGNRPCGCSCCGSWRRRIRGSGARHDRRHRRSPRGSPTTPPVTEPAVGPLVTDRREEGVSHDLLPP